MKRKRAATAAAAASCCRVVSRRRANERGPTKCYYIFPDRSAPSRVYDNIICIYHAYIIPNAPYIYIYIHMRNPSARVRNINTNIRGGGRARDRIDDYYNARAMYDL